MSNIKRYAESVRKCLPIPFMMWAKKNSTLIVLTFALTALMCTSWIIPNTQARVQSAAEYAPGAPNLDQDGDVRQNDISDIKSDEVPALANTLRFLFNTIAISAFALIILLAAIRLLKGKISAVDEKRVLEQKQRKLAEADLDRQRTQLLTVLGALLDIYILVDKNGVCEAIVNNKNDPWWPNQTEPGLSIVDLFPEKISAMVMNTIQQTLENRDSHLIEFEKVVNGETGWFESRTTRLMSDHGGSDKVIWIIRNITARIIARNNARALATRLSVVQETERQAIAADLHDTVGQNLAIARMKFGVIGTLTNDERVSQILSELIQDNEESISSIRETINELAPPSLHRLGLTAALEALAERLTARHGIQFRVKNKTRTPDNMSREAGAIFYRVARELMFNIVKHSQAQTAQVVLSYDTNGVNLDVRDDGIGFQTDRLRYSNNGPVNLKYGSFGLFALEETVRFLEGEMTIESEPGKGTRTRIFVPKESYGLNGSEDAIDENKNNLG